MKLHQILLRAFFTLVVLTVPLRAGLNVTLWDTGAAGRTEPLDRKDWKAVPSNLMALEKDPIKAASDPGYYGRAYQFSGNAAVENQRLIAMIESASGKVSLFTKDGRPAAKLKLKPGPVEIELVRNAADEVVLDLVYSAKDRTRLSLGKDEIVEIRSKSPTVTVEAPIEYAVAPGFVGDDLIFGAVEDSETDSLSIAAENMLVGLLKGEDQALVMTWPNERQGAHLILAREQNKLRGIEAVQLSAAGEPLYLALLASPGIWHRETLNSEFLEKDKPIAWKRPFPARWKTQLMEGPVRTTFAFRENKGTVWRGVAGMFDYPVRFEGDQAVFHLSKKIPPKDDAIIYFLEGENTPPGALAPVDVLKATLGRAASERIVDVEGQALRTHHGACGSGVHRACTCGYTEAIQAVFENGEETDKKSFVNQSIGDMIYFVQRHLERIDEYRAFAKDLTHYLQERAKQTPELKSYIEEIDSIAQQIPQEYENQKENMRSLDYANELSQKTMALTGKKDASNLKAYMELLKAWRAMGGAADYVVAQYHCLTRKMFQDAGYLAANNPKAIDAAHEIRARCKQILRNPDGYEIWPNY